MMVRGRRGVRSPFASSSKVRTRRAGTRTLVPIPSAQSSSRFWCAADCRTEVGRRGRTPSACGCGWAWASLHLEPLVQCPVPQVAEVAAAGLAA